LIAALTKYTKSARPGFKQVDHFLSAFFDNGLLFFQRLAYYFLDIRMVNFFIDIHSDCLQQGETLTQDSCPVAFLEQKTHNDNSVCFF